MLHAMRSQDCDGARRLLGAALSLLLAFRLVFGPELLPQPEPGMVPVCAGTSIVYISLDRSKGDAGRRIAVPCPFHGFAAAPPQPGLPVLAPRPVVFAGHPVPVAAPRVERARRAGYVSRAPPAAV